ncbi:MAG: MGH1-like glycoside hydrolase domain-containing protein, partial [Candidatus Acidiferrales bacterium]
MPKPRTTEMTAEERRLEEARQRTVHWKRWGPYLAERQWGTVREDYSPYGNAWDYFPHDHARSRAYRWGEDGLGGICDRHGEVCFALALWNGRDPILKERLFGLTGSEGNHGEDVKEYYFYLDSTPTHSYMKFLYKYPQAEFPYGRLVEENRQRGKREREFELMDTGVFDDDRYFDVFVEYAKAGAEDVLIRITTHNRGPEAAELRLLPTLWFRNTWSWNGAAERPRVAKGKSPKGTAVLEAEHMQYGRRRLVCEGAPEVLFTENETNSERLYGVPNASPYVKDGINDYIVRGRAEAVNPAQTGTKASAHYRLTVPAGGSVTLRLRFTDQTPNEKMFGSEFDKVFTERLGEADEFYSKRVGRCTSPDAIQVQRQAFAGMLWSKQFFHYDVRKWLEGDPGQPPPPAGRKHGRNREWKHLYNADVIS